MSKIWGFLRADEWIYSKVPMMVGYMLFFQLQTPKAANVFLVLLPSYFMYVSMFLAFSYVINDFFDIEVDKKAGKTKYIAQIPKLTAIELMLGIVLIGCIPIFLVVQNKIQFIISAAATYILGIMYSMPPFRFKERGVSGISECAFAQRCMPLLPILFEYNANHLIYGLFVIISFLDGIRYLLIHQVIDMDNDKKSGVHTFLHDCNSNGKLALRICFFLECSLSLFVLWDLFLSHRIVIVFFLFYLLMEKIGYEVIGYTKRQWLCNYDFVPLELLFNAFIPCVCAVFIAISDPKSGLCLVLPVLTAVYGLSKHVWVVRVFIKAHIIPVTTELLQDLIMCLLITLSVMILQQNEFNLLEFSFDFVASYITNLAFGLIIPLSTALGKANIKSKIIQRIFSLTVITIANVAVILFVMLIVKIGIQSMLFYAFASLFLPLTAVAIPAANLLFFISSAIANRAVKLVAKSSEIQY